MIILLYRHRNGNLEKVGNLAKAPKLISSGIAEDISKGRYFTTINRMSRQCGLPLALFAKLLQ